MRSSTGKGSAPGPALKLAARLVSRAETVVCVNFAVLSKWVFTSAAAWCNYARAFKDSRTRRTLRIRTFTRPVPHLRRYSNGHEAWKFICSENFTVASSLQRGHRLGETVRQVKLFARYSVPLVWGILGLVVGCVATYFGLAFTLTRLIMRPDAVTPEDALTVILVSLISGVFIGSASLYASAQTHWQGAKQRS